MKKIPRIAIWDYILMAVGFFVFFALMRPYGMKNSVSDYLWPLQSLGCCTLIFLGAILTEAIVSYLFRMPYDYSKEWPYQIKKEAIFLAILIVILSISIGQYFTILQWGWSKWHWFWIDEEGNPTLKWIANNVYQDLVWCIFITVYWYYMTKSRMKEHKIQELLSLNDAIEQTESEPQESVETVWIGGESKESLEVSPSDILYIESIANYLSIWYFLDGELKQKRIRNTLKNVEEILSEYPFLLHCHRAFLVNTHFITHVEGNSSGCQIHLFSIDKTIPVSKANIEALRHALETSK